MALDVSRRQVLAHRVRALGLDRRATSLADLAVVDLGVQDTPPGSSDLALAIRLGRPAPRTGDEALVWSWRGSPHVHRRARLPEVAAATWPASEGDAVARLGTVGHQLVAAGRPALDAFALAVRAMAEVVTAPMSKGEASAAVTRRLPDELLTDCKPCGAVHVGEMVFRSTALAAGLELVDDGGSRLLAPLPAWTGPAPDPAATTRALRTYLGLLGPGTVADAAAFVGTRAADATSRWPEDLAPVSVEGRDAWFPEEQLDDLAATGPDRVVRLLPPGDPFLHAGDRGLIVPDAARRKVLWRALGNPGAVLVDGEVVGAWRPKRAGRRLTLTIDPFEPLPAGAGDALQAEAGLVAEVRGATAVQVAFAT